MYNFLRKNEDSILHVSFSTAYTTSSLMRAVWLNSLRKCIEICSMEFQGLLLAGIEKYLLFLTLPRGSEECLHTYELGI